MKIVHCFIAFFYLQVVFTQSKDYGTINYTEHGVAGHLIQKAKSYNKTYRDSTLIYAQQALEESIKFDNALMTAHANLLLAQTFVMKDDFKMVKVHVAKSLDYAKVNKLPRMMVELNRLLALISSIEGDNDKAIKYYNLSLSYAPTTMDSINLKSNIAALYINNKDYKTAELLMQEILDYYETNINDVPKNKLVGAYINYALSIENFNKALQYMDKAVEIAKDINYTNLLVSALQNKAFLLKRNSKNKEAIVVFEETLTLCVANGFKRNTATILINLISLSNQVGEYEKSLEYIEILKTYQKTARNTRAINFHSFKAKQGLNQFEEANGFAEMYMSYMDSVYNNAKDFKYAEFAKKYETEKKEQENELLKKENQIKDLEVAKHKTARNYLMLLSVLGLITLAVTYSRFRAKRKTAKVLAEQNTIISDQKVELEKSNANKQKLFGIIAHDLINPFNAILGYTQLLEEDYDSFDEEQRKQFIATINKYANSNYILTRILLDWAKVQQDRLVANKTQLNYKAIVTAAIQPYLVLANKKKIKVVTNVSESITLQADQNMMKTVVGNLFVNAIKFTPQGGKITCNLNKNEDNTITLEIADNGIGMTQDQLNNLFNVAKATSIKGTNNEKGNGLGLILCKELMELQNGTLQIFSQPNKGSKALVTI